VIVSRYNGTSGWALGFDSNGCIYLSGYNAGSANFSRIRSYQSLPLNKWVHISSQLDMSTFTATTTTSYVMFDGVDVPAIAERGGTNPTALIQAGNLEIGSRNGGSVPFPGKIAQVAIYNAKVTQATILASMHQTLAGTETSLISAYSFNNSINDLNANANNLTAQGSAVATNADSPFGGQADGTISSTLDYAEILATSFSTNTTLTVRVPYGNTIPTSGGVSAMSYSTQQSPYGCPAFSNVYGQTLYMVSSGALATSLSDVDISGLTVTSQYIPQGKNIKVSLVGTDYEQTGGLGTTYGSIKLKESTTQLQTTSVTPSAANFPNGYKLDYFASPAAGSHTYKVAVAHNATGPNFSMVGAATGPVTLTVEGA